MEFLMMKPSLSASGYDLSSMHDVLALPQTFTAKLDNGVARASITTYILQTWRGGG